ncbi:MAG: aspartyl-phosphate phosphatase Spo0E family protein [Sporomusaceae bacterium]|nr:aspartyl-phosphate phosphatase Spo0E family protein [Sporomusaceae bacterium]
MTANIATLRLQIEQLRKQLDQLISDNALTDPEVICVSRELDEMLNHYQKLLQDREGAVAKAGKTGGG